MLFISLCVVGCAMMYAQQMPGLLQKGKADTQDCKAWVDEQLSEMSLKEKIGQLFIHTVAPLQTQRNKNNIYAAIKEYKVGGLLFSSGQLSNQVLLTNYAQSLARKLEFRKKELISKIYHSYIKKEYPLPEDTPFLIYIPFTHDFLYNHEQTDLK